VAKLEATSEERLRQGFASESGGRAAKRCPLSLHLLFVVGTLALTIICSAGTPVAARGPDDATLPTEGSPGGDIYTTGPTQVDLDDSVRRVASLRLPAGNYVVHVSVRAINRDIILTSVLRCFLEGGGFNGVMSVPPTGLRMTLSFTGTLGPLNREVDIGLMCFCDDQLTTLDASVSMTAIRGGTLYRQ
jgi:hypothetical protein